VTLRIATAGLQTTVQDLGRVGHQREAVPVGGAMDRLALRVANLLVGNAECAAALEAALIGPALVFERDALIALAGGDLEATIDHARIPVWHPIWVPRGATLRFGHARVGCRAYIAVAGGLDVPLVFGSRSTYLRGKFGGYNGRPLQAGDLVATRPMSPQAEQIARTLNPSNRDVVVARWSIGATLRPPYSDDAHVRLIAGAHIDALTPAARELLLGGTFRVSPSSDRMGYRLDGKTLELQRPMELLSEGVGFGTVQLPPGGAPIILMSDAQTTGGYPRVGEVASVDLPLVAQLKPGDRIRFRLASVDDAQAEYLAQERDLAQARVGIELRSIRGFS
jgi:antagonist of KipI